MCCVEDGKKRRKCVELEKENPAEMWVLSHLGCATDG